MHLLDTDHVSLISRGGAECNRILRRIESAEPIQIAISIVTFEEQGYCAVCADELLRYVGTLLNR